MGVQALKIKKKKKENDLKTFRPALLPTVQNTSDSPGLVSSAGSSSPGLFVILIHPTACSGVMPIFSSDTN